MTTCVCLLTIRSDKFWLSFVGNVTSILLSLVSGELERLKLFKKLLSSDDRLTDESLLLKSKETHRTLSLFISESMNEQVNSPSDLLERIERF